MFGIWRLRTLVRPPYPLSPAVGILAAATLSYRHTQIFVCSLVKDTGEVKGCCCFTKRCFGAFFLKKKKKLLQIVFSLCCFKTKKKTKWWDDWQRLLSSLASLSLRSSCCKVHILAGWASISFRLLCPSPLRFFQEQRSVNWTLFQGCGFLPVKTGFRCITDYWSTKRELFFADTWDTQNVTIKAVWVYHGKIM